MYAIIEDSGTQMRVAPGDVLDVDPRDLGEARRITFDRVLLVCSDDGDAASIGTPYVPGAAVTAEVLGEVTGDKVRIIRFRRRKGYRRKIGHRQTYLRVRIDRIDAATSAG